MYNSTVYVCVCIVFCIYAYWYLVLSKGIEYGVIRFKISTYLHIDVLLHILVLRSLLF